MRDGRVWEWEAGEQETETETADIEIHRTGTGKGTGSDREGKNAACNTSLEPFCFADGGQKLCCILLIFFVEKVIFGYCFPQNQRNIFFVLLPHHVIDHIF